MSEPVIAYPEKWLGLLRHMLGASDPKRKTSHGYRNMFFAIVGSADYMVLLKMETAGLVKRGRTMPESESAYYFHATLLGCKAIQLGRAAIKRAFSD